MTSKRGLGRGIESLIPAAASENSYELTNEISIKEIVANQFQPRRNFEEEPLNELAQSIRQYGVLQPVVVRKTMSGFELVAGERRWRAAQIAGLKNIPAIVHEYTDGEMMEIALIENIQREQLNPIEEAVAYRRLMGEFGLTQEEVAKKIGRSRSLIANTVRMLNLHPTIQEHVSRGTLTMGQARPLLSLASSELQLEAANTIVEEDLSSRDAEELVKRLVKAPKTTITPKNEKREVFLAEVEEQLKMLFGTQVKIKQGKLKSKIEIEYYSADDLERIIEMIATQPQQPSVRVQGPIIV